MLDSKLQLHFSRYLILLHFWIRGHTTIYFHPMLFGEMPQYHGFRYLHSLLKSFKDMLKPDTNPWWNSHNSTMYNGNKNQDLKDNSTYLQLHLQRFIKSILTLNIPSKSCFGWTKYVTFYSKSLCTASIFEILVIRASL